MIRVPACFDFRNSSGQGWELARVLKYTPQLSRHGCADAFALTLIEAKMWRKSEVSVYRPPCLAYIKSAKRYPVGRNKMSLMSKSVVGALAVGAALVLSPMKADAASIFVEDLLDGNDQQFDVAGLGQAIFSGNSAADGTSGLAFTITVTAVEQPGQSKLNTVSILTKGEGAMDIRTSAAGFGAGAGAGPSQVKFNVATTSVGSPSMIGQLQSSVLIAQGFVNNDNVLFGIQGAASTKIGNNLSFSSVGQQVNTAAVSLNNPLSMIQLFTIEHANSFDVTSFDATMTATIPLPAGGLLLLTALGGVAALRRKRKAA